MTKKEHTKLMRSLNKALDAMNDVRVQMVFQGHPRRSYAEVAANMVGVLRADVMFDPPEDDK